jgi:hypothetical protein
VASRAGRAAPGLRAHRTKAWSCQGGDEGRAALLHGRASREGRGSGQTRRAGRVGGRGHAGAAGGPATAARRTSRWGPRPGRGRAPGLRHAGPHVVTERASAAGMPGRGQAPWTRRPPWASHGPRRTPGHASQRRRREGEGEREGGFTSTGADELRASSKSAIRFFPARG